MLFASSLGRRPHHHRHHGGRGRGFGPRGFGPASYYSVQPDYAYTEIVAVQAPVPVGTCLPAGTHPSRLPPCETGYWHRRADGSYCCVVPKG